MLDKLGEGRPLGGIHVNMMTVVDKLVVNDGGGDATEAVAPLHHVEEVLLELLRVAADDPIRTLTEDLHLALVRFAHTMALESVLVAALLLAHLAVPSKLLETFRFDPVRDGLRS